MKLLAFQFAAEWRKGRDHFLAEALSTAPANRPGGRDQLSEMDQDGINNNDDDKDIATPANAHIYVQSNPSAGRPRYPERIPEEGG